MSEDFIISFEVDGASVFDETINLSVFPRVGERVEFNYVHGKKVAFKVEEIRHFLSSIGTKILHQVTISGTSI